MVYLATGHEMLFTGRKLSITALPSNQVFSKNSSRSMIAAMTWLLLV
jgi:hypothetical protein